MCGNVTPTSEDSRVKSVEVYVIYSGVSDEMSQCGAVA